jgi:DNA processing protein
MLNEENAMLWLASLNHINVKRKNYLLEKVGSALELAEMGEAELTEFGVNASLAHSLYEYEPEAVAARILGELYKKEIAFISCFDKDYPSRLKDIPDRPLGLFVLGKLPDGNKPHLAMVGSRRCTKYGATEAFNLSGEAAKAGCVIVSGMADGIDGMAHKGALEVKGDTIAVLGCGVDICYPAGNRELMENIKATGCIVSELPPGTRPSKYTFPARNRIISGLSDAVAVIEADEKSGTLITVDHALEQGRDVMALPGNISSRLSRGTNKLIREGAGIITCAEDILNTLGINNNEEKQKNSEKNNISLAPEEKLVYDCIHSEPITSDEIVISTGMPTREVQYELTMLELKGLIVRLSGQQYILK